MQEPLDTDKIAHGYNWNQRNSIWIGLVSVVLMFAGYVVFTVNMSDVFKSMSSSIHKDGTVLNTDGIWLRIWAWCALAPVMIPTLITLFLYRFKSEQAQYVQLVKRGWVVSFAGMLLVSVIALWLFKTGSFVPVENMALEVVVIFFAAALIALILNLFLAVLFIKVKR